MAIDGLPFDRPGDKVGKNFSGEVPSGQSACSVTTSPTTLPSRAPTTSAPARVIARRSITACSACCRSSRPDSQWLSPNGCSHAGRVGLGSDHLAATEPSFRENVQILHEIGNEKETSTTRTTCRSRRSIRSLRPTARAVAASTTGPSRSWTG